MGAGEHPQPSASWAKNSIMTECTREISHLQSMNSLVCGSNVQGGPFQREGMGLLEYLANAMPSLPDIAHDGILCTVHLVIDKPRLGQVCGPSGQAAWTVHHVLRHSPPASQVDRRVGPAL
jgi:hypothetical protein